MFISVMKTFAPKSGCPLLERTRPVITALCPWACAVAQLTTPSTAAATNGTSRRKREKCVIVLPQAVVLISPTDLFCPVATGQGGANEFAGVSLAANYPPYSVGVLGWGGALPSTLAGATSLGPTTAASFRGLACWFTDLGIRRGVTRG